MGYVVVKVPVTCPVCNADYLCPLRIEAVVDALDDGAPLRLTADCHEAVWYANAAQTERIREHLARAMNFTDSATPWMNYA